MGASVRCSRDRYSQSIKKLKVKDSAERYIHRPAHLAGHQIQVLNNQMVYTDFCDRSAHRRLRNHKMDVDGLSHALRECRLKAFHDVGILAERRSKVSTVSSGLI